MNFDVDVLIVFAEDDNALSGKENKGWVNQFKKFLEMLLIQIMNKKPHIVLASEKDLASTSALRHAATMVMILSKLQDSFNLCDRSAQAFLQAHPPAQEDAPSQMFKALKSYLPTVDQPASVQALSNYEMYQLDIETMSMMEYTDFFSPQAERQFWMKLVDMAYDIHESILYLNDPEKLKKDRIKKNKTVYLAETAPDMSIQRNIIRRELIRYGYDVLPKHNLPPDYKDAERSITKDLADSDVSVHLIGTSYGEIPNGASISIVELQCNLAMEEAEKRRERSKDFPQLIWINPLMKNATEQQNIFVTNVKRYSEAQSGAEIIQSPIEDFKNLIRDELLVDKQQHSDVTTPGKIAYLVYDKVDASLVQPYKDVLTHQGYRVIDPLFASDLTEVRKVHLHNLQTFDVAVIFKDQINEQWVHMKILDILKSPGLGRAKRIKGKALISTNEASRLNGFRQEPINIINGDKEQCMQKLNQFLNGLS